MNINNDNHNSSIWHLVSNNRFHTPNPNWLWKRPMGTNTLKPIEAGNFKITAKRFKVKTHGWPACLIIKTGGLVIDSIPYLKNSVAIIAEGRELVIEKLGCKDCEGDYFFK